MRGFRPWWAAVEWNHPGRAVRIPSLPAIACPYRFDCASLLQRTGIRFGEFFKGASLFSQLHAGDPASCDSFGNGIPHPFDRALAFLWRTVSPL